MNIEKISTNEGSILEAIKVMGIENIIERAFEAGREMTSSEVKGMMWDYKYKDFQDFMKHGL